MYFFKRCFLLRRSKELEERDKMTKNLGVVEKQPKLIKEMTLLLLRKQQA
jgi:hypothetical protein